MQNTNQPVMKKILFALLALSFVSQGYSQNGDDKIVVIRVLEDIKPETVSNRSVASSPIECRYNMLTNMLELSFKSNLGAVYVTLENLTSGEISDYSGNSTNGIMTMFVSSNSCYTMSITTECGRSFRASFLTGDVSYDD